jgi:hypothetical protein
MRLLTDQTVDLIIAARPKLMEMESPGVLVVVLKAVKVKNTFPAPQVQTVLTEIFPQLVVPGRLVMEQALMEVTNGK